MKKNKYLEEIRKEITPEIREKVSQFADDKIAKMNKEEFKPQYLEALSMLCGKPTYTINPFKGEFKPKKGMKERYSKDKNQNKDDDNNRWT